jgi:hypothetical protein
MACVVQVKHCHYLIFKLYPKKKQQQPCCCCFLFSLTRECADGDDGMAWHGVDKVEAVENFGNAALSAIHQHKSLVTVLRTSSELQFIHISVSSIAVFAERPFRSTKFIHN